MFLVLVVLNTIVEKYTLNPEITLLNQFHAQKALFKVPKICNINFGIENDLPPPTLYHVHFCLAQDMQFGKTM